MQGAAEVHLEKDRLHDLEALEVAEMEVQLQLRALLILVVEVAEAEEMEKLLVKKVVPVS
jgi:hypothetical protein